jgi:two-component system, sporulation sensor kinase D
MTRHYNIYKQKVLWKWLLFLGGMLIVIASLIYTNSIVRKIAADERSSVAIWADAIQRKAALVNYTNDFFLKIEIEERKRVELWAEAIMRLIEADLNEDLTFYSKIIQDNTNIPVVLTNADRIIITTANVSFSTDTIKILEGNLLREFSENEPIEVRDFHRGKIQNLLYYKESLLFSELRIVLQDLIDSFFSEIVTNNPGVPVIITDSTKTTVFAHGNLDSTLAEDPEWISQTIRSMESGNKPIAIDLHGMETKYIYYQDSYLLTQLRYYPYVQFVIIGVFLLIAYILFSISRRSEQNQVWVGMAKETAHQLGTPISSLLAWLQLLREQGNDNPIIDELSNDVVRLESIAERFSKIGSLPVLDAQHLHPILEDSVNYMKIRCSSKIQFFLSGQTDAVVPLNKNLFSWVIENLIKNAIDAMESEGELRVYCEYSPDMKHIYIDISDTGKGIPKSRQKLVFKPGFTTKSRGWGLGLTLAKRIIENYHNGKIFVRQSVQGKGTTFRIVLKTVRKDKSMG